MAQESKSRQLDQYMVRFPDGLRETLKREAERNGRSLNAEIVARLQSTLPVQILMDMGGENAPDAKRKMHPAEYAALQAELTAEIDDRLRKLNRTVEKLRELSGPGIEIVSDDVPSGRPKSGA